MKAWFLLVAGIGALGQDLAPDPMMAERNRALQLIDPEHIEQAMEIGLRLVAEDPLFYPAYQIFEAGQNYKARLAPFAFKLKNLAESQPRYRPIFFGAAMLSADDPNLTEMLVRCAREAPKAWFCLYRFEYRLSTARKATLVLPT